MNIIIPLGGKGERFSKNGYAVPKPLIQILDKCMIDYVLDNVTILKDDKVFIIYNSQLDNYNFSKYVKNKYPFINLIEVNDTKGAVETLYLGMTYILNKCTYNDKTLILDGDTFYTQDITNVFRASYDNLVFYTKKYEEAAIYSYIELNDASVITNIKEKDKISDNANTGAYAFTNINVLYDYCKYILDNNITFKGEPYTSCVISEMIKSDIIFKGYELLDNSVFSLGTPFAVQQYIDNTHAFLFDLDGTLVITDDIYYSVWHKILSTYNIDLTKEIFENYIQGNNDKYVLNTLFINNDIQLDELSTMKDELFIQHINKLKIIDGIYDLITQIKRSGHKLCIVTTCNKNVANEIVKHINLDKSIDFIISSNDCINGKPNSEPYKRAIDNYNISNKKCVIFEDSKTGILSGKGVNPKLIIGIETLYNKTQMENSGVHFSINNFCNVTVDNIINFKENNINCLKNMIKQSSSITDIKDILIDDNKLKGGFIADVISFLIITEDGQKYSQIVKCENKEPNDLSIMARQLKLYEREYYFYSNISSKVNVLIPKCYGLIVNNEYDNVGVVLENLIDKNYKINLNLNTESIEVTLKIVNRMAQMHTKFWNKPLIKMFPELKRSNDDIFCPFFTDFINEHYELFKNKWFQTLNKNQREKCDDIFKDYSTIQQRFSEGNNLTFIHGDIKSPNIFYDTNNDNEPYFIDWQHCAIGKGVQDVIFLIIESFDIENIKLNFYLIKSYYYKKIIEYGVTNYTYDEYDNDIYDAICYIPFFTSVWFGTIPQDDLIDKNFPYFLISKMFYLIELITNK